ncbi:MAG: hypothetical protein OQK78_11680, partial [Gammaproteobacteria bacterium]|nr:hypothetical protein [Gammaproteobacteria bacterium]
IIEGITGLIKATDPEINDKINPATVATYVLRVQLFLNTNDPNQNKVNALANELALKANGWHPTESSSEIFSLQGKLLEAAKLLIYRPMNNA